jgi:hypothetical protein
MVQPFTFTIQTSEQTVGKHLLQAQMPIYVAGYSVCWGFIQYYVNIVATADDMPEGAYIAGNQITMVDCAIQRNATINLVKCDYMRPKLLLFGLIFICGDVYMQRRCLI